MCNDQRDQMMQICKKNAMLQKANLLLQINSDTISRAVAQKIAQGYVHVYECYMIFRLFF